jgi:hypothetical protein
MEALVTHPPRDTRVAPRDARPPRDDARRTATRPTEVRFCFAVKYLHPNSGTVATDESVVERISG